mmetsp:Transcript_33933/g.57972  ORF Transcript_33933/g.57972 Transcript_33933/m.57972 type:complete len:314 (+) Transcript_33933:113-1054(+)
MPSSSTQAYVTLIFGDEAYVCAAAVLGAALRAIDPSRPRMVLTWNVSGPAVLVLQHGGLWHVLEQSEMRTGWVRGKRQLTGLKDPLWSLPHKRILFFDVDHFPLPSLRTQSRIQKLWQHPGKLVATVEGAQFIHSPCFNSGLMLLTPNAKSVERLVQAQRQRVWNKRPPVLKCMGGGIDQALQNHAFPDWQRLDAPTWRLFTSAFVPPRECNNSAAQLAEHVDSFHFFGQFAPWRPGCERCNAARRVCAGRRPRPHGQDRCAAQAAAAAIWWETFAQLPERTRQWCSRVWEAKAGMVEGSTRTSRNHNVGTCA